ncbi:MAG: pyridoxamine 5'-phosphate oxidase [Gammaproteobacteria bacterium]
MSQTADKWVPVPYDVVDRFQALLERARSLGEPEPTAMSLATVDPEGRPSVRTVLLKEWNAEGVRFYTNLNSRKARHIASRPDAALCFYWRSFWQQVLMEGRVEPLSESENDRYFASRPRSHQIGAWSSAQSESLESRTFLETEYKRYERTFEGKSIPRPPFWGGFCLHPHTIEFWTGQANRLHEREWFALQGEHWNHGLRFP